MQILLIDGTFTLPEAEELLSEIFKVKIRFHENRIQTIRDTEEDIERSERRIIGLQNDLGKAIARIKNSGKDRITLYAELEVNTAGRLTQ